MNANKDDGGPAFPHMRRYVAPATYEPLAEGGMSLRDYAIVHFMAALISKDEFDWESGKLQCDNGSCVPIIIATEQADAMLAAREKGAK